MIKVKSLLFFRTFHKLFVANKLFVTKKEDAPMSVNTETYLEKEINQQQFLIHELLHDEKRVASFGVDGLNLGKVESIQLLACGSSFHAALFAKNFIEEACSLLVSATPAHEFLFTKRKSFKKTLFILISQSGETKDILDCLELLDTDSPQMIAVCNDENSTLAKKVTKTFFLDCGKEKSVAATKTFMMSCLSLYLFSLNLATNRGTIRKNKVKEKLSEINTNLKAIFDNEFEEIINHITAGKNLTILGIGKDYPAALEAALKIREVTYHKVEALSLGEIKHGHLASFDSSKICIIFISEKDYLNRYQATMEHLKQTRAQVIIISDTVDFFKSKDLYSLNFVIYAQILALRLGKKLNRPLDHPRNLEKVINF